MHTEVKIELLTQESCIFVNEWILDKLVKAKALWKLVQLPLFLLES